jgi:hypothetical protein
MDKKFQKAMVMLLIGNKGKILLLRLLKRNKKTKKLVKKKLQLNK